MLMHAPSDRAAARRSLPLLDLRICSSQPMDQPTNYLGAGNASQEDLMVKDECILVDEQDNITGHANKYQSHRRAEQGALPT